MNYPAEVLKMLKINGAFGIPERACAALSEAIKMSKHFILPVNANLMDGALKNAFESGDSIILPFDYITMSFPLSDGTDMMTLAIKDEDRILVYSFSRFEVKEFSLFSFGTDISKFIGTNGDIMYNNTSLSITPMGTNSESSTVCLIANVAPVANLVACLACSNIGQKVVNKVSDKVNIKRIKKGKLPIFEQRVLMVMNEKPNKHGVSGSQPMYSKRQHMRRGHIRRLPDKKIWVRPCVVGDSSKGVIESIYDMN